MRVLITGAASGVGYQVGVMLARRGHLVYMTCRSVAEVFVLRERLEREDVPAVCFKLDLLSDDINIADSLDIDCLFNHAGIGTAGSILYMDEESLRDIYEVNFFRSFLLLKKVYRHMVDRRIAGKIFVTSSLLGMFPMPFFGVYGSSKAAISQVVKTMQEEEKVFRHGISFCLVEPGAYATGFNQVMIDSQENGISFCLVEPGAYATGFNQVMIDSQEKYVDSSFYREFLSMHPYQRKLFFLLESRKVEKLARRIVLEMENKKTKKILRIPWIQGFFLKLYNFFFH